MKKCQIHGCKKEAKECVKKGTINNGIASKKDFWHCGDHDSSCVDKVLNDKTLSIQMKNPFCDAKSVIKINSKSNK